MRPAGQGGAARKDLADLVEEFAARSQAGEALDLEEYARAHAVHAEELRRLLPAVQALADLGRSVPDTSAAPTGEREAHRCGALPAARLGDFRLVREVGRGGMGIVFEAEQVSLGRRVAVKVLPSAAALDGKHLQRFKTEAQAAALLAHPHIVPVIAVGEDQGAHFFAMQFIDGQSLAVLISGLRARRGGSATPVLGEAEEKSREPGSCSPTLPLSSLWPAGRGAAPPAADRSYFREAAHLVLQAAQALDHAHQVGVIHRDVKPGNLLVDDQGHLWVTDFGLARLHTGCGLTTTGDLLGTLRYMSPEQAQGQRVPIDHRTDVYSLGVTAYELLTLEHAFPGDDRQDLLRRIGTEEPPRPQRLNPAVPAELEAVVLKAMEKDPADRYATAQEFADDLARFLSDQPVLARRSSRWRVAVKWARRHAGMVATAAAAAGVVLVVLAIAVALLTLSNRRLREQETQTRQALRKAEENAGRANRNASHALEVLDGLSLELADERIRRDRTLARKVEKTLEQALKVYEDLAVEEDPAVRMGVAHQMLGEIEAEKGKVPEALAHYRAALAEGPRLAQVVGEPNARYFLGCCHRLLGLLLQGEGRTDEAEKHFRQCQEYAEGLVPDPSDKNVPVSYRDLLAQCWYERAIRREEAAPDEALRFYRRSLDLLSQLSAENPGALERRRMVADAHFHFGILGWAVGRAGDAADHFRAARDAFAALAADLPDGSPGPGEPGQNENFYAWFLATCPDETFRDPARAVAFARKATNRAPLRGDFWNTLGVACLRAGDARDAVAALEKAVELQKGAEATDWFYLALAHHRLGDKGKARDCYDKALAWLEGHRATGFELRFLRNEAAAAVAVPRDDTRGKEPGKKPGKDSL